MKRVVLAAVILIVASLSGCTKVTVKRVDSGKEEGQRYYLPQPILIVTPQEDGTMEVRVENIADRTEAYAVSATSYIASHKLVMKVNQGLLTEVSLTKNSTAVAAETVKAAGELEKSKIEAKTEAAVKASEKQEASAKERRDEFKKQRDNLTQAEIELAQAIAENEALKTLENVTPADKQAAAVAEAKARAKVAILKAQLSSGGVGFETFSKIDSQKSAPSPTLKFEETTRPGPLVLLIKEDSKSGVLQLVPIQFNGQPQKMFKGYEVPAKVSDGEHNEVSKKIEFEKDSLDEIQVGNSPVKIDIKTKTDLTTLKVGKMTGSTGSLRPSLLPNVKFKNSKTFEIEFKANTPPDTYKIEFFGQVKKDSPNIEGELKVKIIP